jgi:hypothetical protein
MNRSVNAKLDRVSGTKLGILWFLPAFSIVLVAVVLAVKVENHLLVAIWSTVSVVAALAFCWAFRERTLARRTLGQLLNESGSPSAKSPYISCFGKPATESDMVQQFDVTIGLIALHAQIRTCPRIRSHAFLPTIVTLLLGWWSLPFGPIWTISIVLHNLTGGTQRSIASIISELHEPEVPRAPWWKRQLARTTATS